MRSVRSCIDGIAAGAAVSCFALVLFCAMLCKKNAAHSIH